MVCGTLMPRGGEQAAEGQTAPKSRCHTPSGEPHAWLAPPFYAAKRDDMNMDWDARAGVLGEPNYKGKGRPFGAGKTRGDVSVPLT